MNVAGISDEWNQTAQQHCEAIADQWRRKYPELEIEVDVRRDHPVDGILAAAKSADAQLVVVCGHRRRPLTAALLGCVGRGVVQHAICPVAVVHVPTVDT
ncbi:universal stress protein family protein [Kribbella orskensis]|uniref:Universal stress protein family protein n=1 Tax=Kribbella orskensis TaxID=2512216 RepID=A0ABY2BAQ1_9ACTN|nr:MULTISPECIES: universal stress protein [Kribbella]TCN31203.1 universal stress protein family protein [Kribbella sp. VKM Ac-2500]TCO11709.1 universal stress protein family protein [Kribbella orskensis]